MEWVRGKTIGHGSFAAVSLAKPVKQSSILPPLMAVKSCGVSHCVSLMNECRILEQLQGCPEIIRCYGDSITIENGQRLYNVALEYASGGALSEKVKNSGGLRLSENEIRRYTNSIVKGLDYIHRNGFVHCDIKLQNVLLVCEGGEESVKIADFGLAKKTTVAGAGAGAGTGAGELNSNSKYGIRGTPMYMAPETVVGGEQESASDVWALGCLVTEMITGNSVWNCSDIGNLLMKIGVGTEVPEIPGKLSEDGKDFIGKCLLRDPRKRWTAEMLLNHPFVNTVSFKEETENQIQISPRDPFDFPDWESESDQSCSVTPEFDCWFRSKSPAIPPAARLGQLLTDQRPNWSVSNNWVKVR